MSRSATVDESCKHHGQNRECVCATRLMIRPNTLLEDEDEMSRVMRNPYYCMSENKGADQLCGNRTADQRLCFRTMYSTTPLLS